MTAYASLMDLPREAPSIRVLYNENNIGVIANAAARPSSGARKICLFRRIRRLDLSRLLRAGAAPARGQPRRWPILRRGDVSRWAKQSTVRRTAGSAAADARRTHRCRRCEQLLRSTDNWILTGSAVFRRECVDWAGGFDARLGSFADGFIARKIALRYGFYFEPKIVASWVVFPDSVSRRTARDLQRSKYILDAVPKLIAADSGFPSWYADAFRDRWRFAACRLALQADPIERAVVLELGAGSAADKAKFESILGLLPRQPARLVILAWLWYRLRPTSLTALLRTMLAMRGLRLTFGFRSGRIPGMTAATAARGDS